MCGIDNWQSDQNFCYSFSRVMLLLIYFILKTVLEKKFHILETFIDKSKITLRFVNIFWYITKYKWYIKQIWHCGVTLRFWTPHFEAKL